MLDLLTFIKNALTFMQSFVKSFLFVVSKQTSRIGILQNIMEKLTIPLVLNFQNRTCAVEVCQSAVVTLLFFLRCRDWVKFITVDDVFFFFFSGLVTLIIFYDVVGFIFLNLIIFIYFFFFYGIEFTFVLNNKHAKLA